MGIVRYKGELFYSDTRRGENVRLVTTIHKKAVKHGFDIKPNQPKIKWVPTKEVKLEDIEFVGPRPGNRYRVKYKGYFWRSISETDDTVTIFTNHSDTAQKFDLSWDYYGGESGRLTVPRDEIMEMKDVKERVGLLSGVELVYEIVDENEDEYLLHPGPDNWTWKEWEKKGDYYELWVSKEEVFVYNETDEPLRY